MGDRKGQLIKLELKRRFDILTVALMLGVFSGAAQETFTEYHRNGKVAVQGSKVDGKLIGEHATFYKNGNLETVSRYNAGYLLQKRAYYESGELQSTFYFIDGTEFLKAYFYYKNGQLEKEGKLDREDLEVGEWFYYSEDNELQKKVIYEKGKVVG